jgi:hypothetical protein
MSLPDIAKRYKLLQDAHEAKNEELKLISAEWTECEKELLEAMTEEGVNSIKVEGVGLMSMRTKNYLNVTAANKSQFYSYLQKSGNGGLLKLDVNPRTLTSFLGTHLEHLIKEKVTSGADEITARNESLEFLKAQGAAYFSERGISLRAK